MDTHNHDAPPPLPWGAGCRACDRWSVVVMDSGPVPGGAYGCSRGHRHATVTDANICDEQPVRRHVK